MKQEKIIEILQNETMIAISRNLKTTNTHKIGLVELSALTFRNDLNPERVKSSKECW